MLLIHFPAIRHIIRSMIKPLKIFTQLFFIAAFVFFARGQTTPSSKPVAERTYFNESEMSEYCVTLPPDILQAVLKTKEVEEALSHASREKQNNPIKLFLGAKIHLSTQARVDWVVKGVFPLSGADNDWFWIVSSVDNIPKVVLWTGCLSLEVRSSKTNGYRDIRSSWNSASSAADIKEYRFNGKKYILWKRSQQTLSAILHAR
jgi:hypothetical protein